MLSAFDFVSQCSAGFLPTFTFCDVGYRQIALGLAVGNVVMIFADRQCGVARKARTAPAAQKSLLHDLLPWSMATINTIVASVIFY